MAVFSARNVSASNVPVDAERIWTQISDPAVLDRVMTSSMQRTGRRFAVNLYRRLELDPATTTIEQRRG